MSRFFGFPVFGLPAKEKMVLLLAMEGLEAEDEIKERGANIGPGRLYDLTLLATGSKAEAERAELGLRSALLRAGRLPAE